MKPIASYPTLNELTNFIVGGSKPANSISAEWLVTLTEWVLCHLEESGFVFDLQTALCGSTIDLKVRATCLLLY